MNPIRYLSMAVVLVLGCQGLPTVTRTGDVKDVIIGDSLASGEITVNPGDEVRWVNKRGAPVRVILIDPVSDKQVSCKSNFGGWMTSRDTAQLARTKLPASVSEMPARSGIPSGWNQLGLLVSKTFRESSRLAGMAARPLVRQMIKTAAKAAVKPVLEQVMQPMINRVTPVIQRAQGRPLPRLRRQRCLQRSECDIEQLLRKVARTLAEG